jgi:hypothetical protein
VDIVINLGHKLIFIRIKVRTISSRMAGRPNIRIDYIKARDLLRSQLSLGKVASALKISTSTLRRLIVGHPDLSPPAAQVSDEELRNIIRSLLLNRELFGTGEVIVSGHLRAIGVKVTRDRVRSVLRILDQENAIDRRPNRLVRRVYKVKGPNYLWHIDGFHKLIHYGIVIHGCIDGFSRKLLYLGAANNNRAETPLQFFEGACRTFGVPSRCRADRGGENIRIGLFMVQQRGTDRSSIIYGPSTRNQRIERAWRDVSQQVIFPSLPSLFISFFLLFPFLFPFNR